MTYPDENRYPRSASPGWHLPHTDPRSYGYDAPRYDPYGQAARYEPYGQGPWDEPYAHETHRHSADLTALRSAYRLLRRTSTLTALGSFVVYVVLSCGAPGLMGSKIAGELSLGMALGVLQLVVTFAAVFWYGRSAQRSVDPLARAVREQAVAAGRNAGVAR
ncbi:MULTISPECIES: DUF485 domain-containing protein [unclassified Streptomyces]|uniref:DUF485 domain-containing protein n=1 Tax=unclassified Streptomyces TaxID=2593676 RepID=UPI00236685F6|nr:MULTISPECIES: DUF485 domain-containing protein [unclassified Streptomyces]MDF3140368.1 DUF485 domain-containing protein [Streptomyces sp. T21Q-yed]WDF43711.1 DUF485 domain-containing protein [Streptomyces sp. T12]